MAYKTGILLGRITKISGFDGAVIVRSEKILPENMTELKSVFIEIDGRPVPFLVLEMEYSGTSTLRLKFTGYESAGKMKEFTGCRIFLTTECEAADNTDDFKRLIGYKVAVKGDEILGTIVDIIENRAQLLLVIRSHEKGGEILVPLHEHFIVRIGRREKTIFMDIPEGLAEINQTGNS
jgi:16S rRNA processing protein RimM